MAQDYSQVNFRIPTKLKEQIEEASITNNRSITSELVSRLEESFNKSEENHNVNQIFETLEENNKKLERAMQVIDKLMDKIIEIETNKPTN